MGVITYTMQALSPSEHELTLYVPVKGKIMNMAFARAKARVKKEGHDMNADIKEMNYFDSSPRFYNLLKTGCSNVLKDVVEQVKDDDIHILKNDVKRAWFERDGKNWRAVLVFQGVYADKR